MSSSFKSRLPEILKKHQPELVKEWGVAQATRLSKQGAISPEELREQSAEFLKRLAKAVETDSTGQIDGAAFDPVKEHLASVSRGRTLQGFTSSETASFVFSLKRPLFNQINKELGSASSEIAQEILAIGDLIDALGLFTVEAYQKTREEVILRQGQELLELSTPVVKLWDGVLALPLIGTLDSARTQVVMESLLQKIVETGADVAIIDITGVPTVDTLVAQHLLKTVTAARLMGADCIISGIRPQIAQTIVHLGVELGDIITKASLADAFKVAIQRAGLAVVKVAAKKAN